MPRSPLIALLLNQAYSSAGLAGGAIDQLRAIGITARHEFNRRTLTFYLVEERANG